MFGLTLLHLLIQAANGGKERPEARLYGAMVGGILFPIGLWIFSWTQFGHIHWIVSRASILPPSRIPELTLLFPPSGTRNRPRSRHPRYLPHLLGHLYVPPRQIARL